MGIEITCDGNKCRNRNLDTFYCVDCYLALENELDKAYQRINELEEELKSKEIE